MRNRLLLEIILGVLGTSAAFGQDKVDKPVALMTVCEVLLNPTTLNNEEVAVVGRLEVTDQGYWLSEDECGRSVLVNSNVMRNLIWLNSDSSSYDGFLSLESKLLRPKLEQVQKTTKLRTHEETYCASRPGVEMTCSRVTVKDHWAAANGKIETMENRDHGFGPLNGAPAQLTFKVKHILIVYPEESK